MKRGDDERELRARPACRSNAGSTGGGNPESSVVSGGVGIFRGVTYPSNNPCKYRPGIRVNDPASKTAPTYIPNILYLWLFTLWFFAAM